MNLFIADDVGLGKTIEAGLITRELLMRKKVISLVLFALLGGVSARTGDAGVSAGAIRVLLLRALAMALTTGVEMLFGTTA